MHVQEVDPATITLSDRRSLRRPHQPAGLSPTSAVDILETYSGPDSCKEQGTRSSEMEMPGERILEGRVSPPAFFAGV